MSKSRPGLPGAVALAVAALFPFLVLRLKLTPFDDADGYWHIVSGRLVRSTHALTGPDPLSRFTAHEWVRLDWLSDVAMSGAFDLGGYALVSWLFAALGVVLFVSLYALCRGRAGVLVATFVAVAAWVATTASQSQRPQTVSFILLALTVLAWGRVARAETARTPWWLVLVTWLWACCHGFWFMAPLVGVVVVVGLALDRSRTPRELARLGAVPVLCVLVAALTPVGPRLLAQPFLVGSYAGIVTEWRSPDVREPYVMAAVALLVLVVVGWARATTKVSWVDVLLWGVALGWTLLYARTVALGAVVAAPAAAASLHALVGIPKEVAARRETPLVAGGAIAAVVLAAVLAPSVAARPGGVPLGLAGAVGALPKGTVVLNDEAVGGWLLLEHPNVEPVIDTRNHLFAVDYITRYVAARQAEPGWQDFVASTGARAALVKAGEPIAQALPHDLGWRVVGEDGGYVLVTAPR